VKRSALFVGALLADYEVGRPPLHLTVVGPKDDPAARALFEAALQYPSFYKRLEWRDTREGKLLNPDVQYPSVPRGGVCLYGTDVLGADFQAGGCLRQS
jgi:hypothetical protein